MPFKWRFAGLTRVVCFHLVIGLQSVIPISFRRWLILVAKGEERISREGGVSLSEMEIAKHV